MTCGAKPYGSIESSERARRLNFGLKRLHASFAIWASSYWIDFIAPMKGEKLLHGRLKKSDFSDYGTLLMPMVCRSRS